LARIKTIESLFWHSLQTYSTSPTHVAPLTVPALQRPSFYAQTYNHQGDTMSQAPKKISKHDFRGATFAGGFVDADTVHAQQIGSLPILFLPSGRNY